MNGDRHSVETDGGAESASVRRTRVESAGGMDESEVFHILGNDRRRKIICALITEDEAMSVSDLARRIATEEEGDDSSKSLYKSVYVSLQQTHLPKLDEKGIVVYDTDAQRVEAGPAFTQIQTYLRATNRRVSPLRSTVLLSLSALGLLVALGLTVHVSVLQDIGTAVVGVIFLLLIVVLAASRSQVDQ